MNRIKTRVGKALALVLFAALLAPFGALTAKDAKTGVFAKYENSLDEVRKEYARGVAADRKDRENRERELRLNDNRNNNNNNNRHRTTTRTRTDQGEAKRRFSDLLDRHKGVAMELQNALNNAGFIGYDFPFYADEMARTFQNRGFREFTSKNEFRTLQGFMDPDKIFEFAEYDMAQLEKIQFQPGATPPFNPNADSYRAFFYFYESLEAYRHFTHGLQKANNDYASVWNFERRLAHLRLSSEKLHRLLLKNAPDIAMRLNLPEIVVKLEAYYKRYAREKTDFTNKFISETNNISTPSERLRKEMKERFNLLDRVAFELRKSEKDKKAARRKQKKGEEEEVVDDKPQFKDLVGAFADLPDAEQLERALAYFKARKLLENTPDTPLAKTPLPGKKDDPDRTPATPEELTQWKSSQVEIESFRKEFAGTDKLIVDGVSDEGARVLKLTFTPKFLELFDQTVQKYADSMSREMINAKAYTAVRAAEQDPANTPTAQELEEIRTRMTEFRKQRSAKPETKPTPAAEDWE